MRTFITAMAAAAVLILGTAAQAFPGKGGKGGHPAASMGRGGFPPGLARQGGIPPGLAKKGGLPPGLAKKQGWASWQNDGPWGHEPYEPYAPGTFPSYGYPPAAYPFEHGPGYSGYAHPWSQQYPSSYGDPAYGTSGYFSPPYAGYRPFGYQWRP